MAHLTILRVRARRASVRVVRLAALFGIVALLLSACGRVEDPLLQTEWDPSRAAPPPEKPFVPANPDREVFFGDLHIHTAFSTDAFTMGVRALPEDAYTFARGGEIGHALGYPIRLSRPLDFAAVTDHSEYLGLVFADPPDVPLVHRSIRERFLEDSRLSLTVAWFQTVTRMLDEGFGPDELGGETASRDAWQETIAAAKRHNRPGVFTTFIAYEWSRSLDDGMLHRNVFYRGDAVPDLPVSSLTSPDPQQLWQALDDQRASGMDVLAIPHNGNLSDGRMYTRADLAGEPMTRNYAEQRLRNEPLSEILQVKGSSETHPLLSPTDEFADFELHEDVGTGRKGETKGSYARDALRTGLEMGHDVGFNPYRFGVIGSSDGHNASSPVEEGRHHGKLPILDGSPAIRLGRAYLLPKSLNRGGRWNGGGLAAIWAEANTRDALFDAMRRRETYATSGTRLVVRCFGGWALPDDLTERADFVAAADAVAVPMGGILRPRPGDTSPELAVWALMDPDGAHLDRIQIIKAWLDADGRSHERIFDVAASGDRTPEPGSGRLPPVGNTVDVRAATWTNTIGTPELRAQWRDPEFDPEVPALYYARVLEIPTPRWSTYDAALLGVPAPQPTSLQERAITSAIWYDPPTE